MRGGALVARAVSWLRFEAQRWLVLLGAVRAAFGISKRRPLLCIGDSHIEPMTDVRKTKQLPKTAVSVVSVSGATASGIANPNSQTRARPRFEKALKFTTRRYWVLACLGEVDAGFLVFTSGSPQERCDAALAKYFAFLAELVLARDRKLLVVTVVPPLVEDYATWEGLYGQRRNVDASWQERSDMTVYWNDEVVRWCAERGVPVLDLWSRVTDPDTGRALPAYVNKDARDHHLDRQLHVVRLVEELRGQGFR